ncbi:MAG: hypothetical protein C0497_13660 [Gemmatimonas sp.]|nr:hypothetical protein [Gemmatimonas sp.]
MSAATAAFAALSGFTRSSQVVATDGAARSARTANAVGEPLACAALSSAADPNTLTTMRPLYTENESTTTSSAPLAHHRRKTARGGTGLNTGAASRKARALALSLRTSRSMRPTSSSHCEFRTAATNWRSPVGAKTR